MLLSLVDLIELIPNLFTKPSLKDMPGAAITFVSIFQAEPHSFSLKLTESVGKEILFSKKNLLLNKFSLSTFYFQLKFFNKFFLINN